MGSASKCIFFVYAAFLLQYVIVPTLALSSTKYIDKLCQRATNKTFCVQTLTAYPPATRATDLFPLAKAVIDLAITHAQKCENLSIAAANKMLSLKEQFTTCGKAFVDVEIALKGAAVDLKDPEDANYSVMICTDYTKNVEDLIGYNSDEALRTLMGMTWEMDKLLDIAVAATLVLGG